MYRVADSTRGPFHAVQLFDDASGSRVTLVPSRGALATSFVARGREWLYLDEGTLLDATQNVRGGIPVLFPSPGRLENDRYECAGKSGAMKQHGFARASVFREVGRGDVGSAWVEMELADTAATRAVFPFGFRLRLRFALRGATLSLSAAVHNTGVGPLPFALGYHPYFAVALAEKARCKIPSRATRAWDNVRKREIALGPIDLATSEVDLHLLDHDSNGATLETVSGTVDLGGNFTHWVIWTLPEREFVCLEPWSAPRNALNSREGLVTLGPGEERRFGLELAVR